MQKILNLKQGTLKAMFFMFFLLCSTVDAGTEQGVRNCTGRYR